MPEMKLELTHHTSTRALRLEAPILECPIEKIQFAFNLIYFNNIYRIHFVF